METSSTRYWAAARHCFIKALKTIKKVSWEMRGYYCWFKRAIIRELSIHLQDFAIASCLTHSYSRKKKNIGNYYSVLYFLYIVLLSLLTKIYTSYPIVQYVHFGYFAYLILIAPTHTFRRFRVLTRWDQRRQRVETEDFPGAAGLPSDRVSHPSHSDGEVVRAVLSAR